jgi:hypothetical protein
MSTEVKILIENIKNFRHYNLITEAVDNNDIVDAIQNHEYIYIYYAGDKSIKKGYRTIKPFVLGNHATSGNLVLRAWQDRGKSDSGAIRKPIPMWRLFRVDKIASIYPTGKKFVDKEGKVLIPDSYKDTDEDIPNPIAAVTRTPEKMVQTKGMDSISKPNVVAQKVSAFDTQTSKWKRFYNANKNNRKATAQDINKLYNIASRVMKTARSRYLVVINDKNEFELVDVINKDKIPPESIVGTLTNLYDTLVKPIKSEPEKDKFFKQRKEAGMKKEPVIKKEQMMKENITNNPIERKTFFK